VDKKQPNVTDHDDVRSDIERLINLL